MLASELLRRGQADSVVILNYATELEEQMVQRAQAFWEGVRNTTHFETPWNRCRSAAEILRPLRRGSVLFSLLQKFHETGDEEESNQGASHAGEVSGKIVVIIDEAHRGVPDEGVYINNVLKRYGEDQTQIFFTATPKADTLQSHGIRGEDAYGVFFSASSTHTQADAIAARYTLNPLEKYLNAVGAMKADGQTLVQLNGKISMKDFVDRLQKQRKVCLLEQQANYVVDHLQAVYDDMPNMRQMGHQIKHLVVTDSQQSVYDLGQRLKVLTSKKGKRNNLGEKMTIGVFFSGLVKAKNGKMIRDREANGQEPDQKMLGKADIVVCCQKFLAGWDEWRVCSIFLCKRTHSEEHLQQLLARATRARPGTGKKRPLIYDLSNHPDDVGAAISRFWFETRHYEGRLGEVTDLAVQIRSFPGVIPSGEGLPVADVLSRFGTTELLLLRAHIVRYYRAAASVSASESPLPFKRLGELLLELNLELKGQLFGGSSSVAKAEAFEASALIGRFSSGKDEAMTGAVPVASRAKNPIAALRMMRSSLHLGRRKRARTDVVATPVKRSRQSNVDVSNDVSTPHATSERGSRGNDETPQKVPAPVARDPLAELKEGLKQTVEDLASRHWNSLPDEGDPDVEVADLDTRDEEMRLFTFASFPLREFAHTAVRAAEKSLQRKLTANLAAVLKASWEHQRSALETDFIERKQTQAWNRQQTLEAIDHTTAEFAEVVDAVGSQTGGWQKRKLLMTLNRHLPADPTI